MTLKERIGSSILSCLVHRRHCANGLTPFSSAMLDGWNVVCSSASQGDVWLRRNCFTSEISSYPQNHLRGNTKCLLRESCRLPPEILFEQR